MSLTQVSQEAITQEQQIQKDIFYKIDEYQNIIFNAGAGAGKTYALIESLKYIIQTKGKQLNSHNQNIICITYTNVATNEIKERLGNTKLVKVSTIHERLWDLIKDYQKQLVEVHTEKLTTETSSINEDLATVDKFEAYRNVEEKSIFINAMIQNKDYYYQCTNKGAAEFRTAVKSFLNEEYYSLLSNVGNFKSLIGKLYKIKNYEECLSHIECGEYKKVTYDARFNNDRLHKMLISHDTLLEYAYQIINNYERVRQIILDKYPYILVDEYQDTDEHVIKILKLLSDYSEQINHNLFIGYFGDIAQNIYDTGVGDKISELHPDLHNIAKVYNRRSTNEIIQIINKIRNDDIRQESIYNDADGGSIDFYNGEENDINSFIEKYKTEWNINQDNQLHCLVLTNELVAKYNGFENIYQKLKVTPYFKTNWKNINTEILSQDLSKLGIVPNLFFRILDFKIKLENPTTSLLDLAHEKIYKALTFKEVKELLRLLQSISGESLKSFIESIFQIYNEADNLKYKKIIEEIFELETYTFDGFLNYLLNKLFSNIEDENIESAKEKLVELLEVNNIEYIAWFDFISKIENKDIIYHTYHGTKGEEYKNVIVLMQNNFGKDKKKFSSFFTNYNIELNDEELSKYTNTKNLLYVSCSRAIENLRILYLDDISDFRDGIESIFNTIKVCNE
ncbi:MAG: ATP-dependent helicase [Campylobacterota bacterium]|nr:ATP-dependent helicase [Campylobacterota bacterium]